VPLDGGAPDREEWVRVINLKNGAVTAGWGGEKGEARHEPDEMHAGCLGNEPVLYITPWHSVVVFPCEMWNVMDVIHWTVVGWGGIQGVLTSMVASALVVGCCLDAFSAFYTAYKRACMRLEDESWLRNNCRDPVFFSQMRAHTTLCADVESNARVGAFWAALREVSDDTKAYLQPLAGPAVGIVVLFLLLIPLCCLCAQRIGMTQSRRFRSLPVHRQSVYLRDV